MKKRLKPGPQFKDHCKTLRTRENQLLCSVTLRRSLAIPRGDDSPVGRGILSLR